MHSTVHRCRMGMALGLRLWSVVTWSYTCIPVRTCVRIPVHMCNHNCIMYCVPVYRNTGIAYRYAIAVHTCTTYRVPRHVLCTGMCTHVCTGMQYRYARVSHTGTCTAYRYCISVLHTGTGMLYRYAIHDAIMYRYPILVRTCKHTGDMYAIYVRRFKHV